MSRPLIIDTDVALGVWHEGRPRDIDDGFAIVEAMNSTELELVGITTVFGNGPHAEVFRVAQELVDLKAAKVPVRGGATAPLPASGALPPSNAAVDFMAEQLSQRPMAVAAIGPLTNMGLLAHHYPAAAANITTLIAVAGRTPGRKFFIGDTGPVQDFNFENDPRAAGLIFATGVPTVLAGFELTSQVHVTEADLQTIKERGNPTADYFYDNSLAWCRHWTKTFAADPGFHPWDSAAISWLKHPEFFVAEQRGWNITPAETKNANATLDCALEYSGTKLTYLTGFAHNGASQFVADVVTSVY